MNLKFYSFLAILPLMGCNSSHFYSDIKQAQSNALLDYLNYGISDEGLLSHKVSLDKSRLKISLKKIVHFIEKNHPDMKRFLIIEINSFPDFVYQGLVFDLDYSKGFKFKYANGKMLFSEKYDSEFKDYQSYLDQYIKQGCDKFHAISKSNSPNDIFIPYSFITEIDFNRSLIVSCAFQAYYWRIDNNLKGVNIFKKRDAD